MKAVELIRAVFPGARVETAAGQPLVFVVEVPVKFAVDHRELEGKTVAALRELLKVRAVFGVLAQVVLPATVTDRLFGSPERIEEFETQPFIVEKS